MALPSDVTTCTVTFGPYVDALGAATYQNMVGKITPSSTTRHAATGTVIVDIPISIKLDSTGSGSVALPYTDLDVLVTDDGQPLTYTMSWVRGRYDDTPANARIFALPQASGATVDYDLFVAVQQPTPDPIYLPSVTSVNGQTGAVSVTAASLSDLDTAVAAQVNASSSATELALKAAFDPLAPPHLWPGVGRGIAAAHRPGFYINGINLGFGPATFDTTVFWGTGYDFTGVIKPRIDKIVALGANSTRIQLSYSAYAANPAQFKTRFKQVMDYTASVGLKAIVSLLNNIDDGNRSNLNTTLRTQYQAMIADTVGSYVGAGFIIGWDIGNELNSGTYGTLMFNMATDIKAVDPNCKVTASRIGSSTGITDTMSHISSCDSYVDFHDIHIYQVPSETGWFSNWFDDVRALTAKPFLIGEFGANSNATLAGGPHLWNQYQNAAYYAAMRKYAHGGGLMGFMCWEIQDDDTTSQFGLYDNTGAPRAALAEWLKFPGARLDAARDMDLSGPTPIHLSNFAVADSATSLPAAAPLGQPLAAVLGTWGVSGKLGYLVTDDAAHHNVAVAEMNTADVDLELSIKLVGNYNFGIVYRYVDTTHWSLLQFNLASSGSVFLYENNGGTFTSPWSAVGSNYQQTSYSRIRLIVRGTTAYIYLFDQLLASVAVSLNLNATKHGVYLWHGTTNQDAGSKLVSFVGRVDQRRY